MNFQFDEKGKFFTDIVTKEPVSAMIQTITHTIEGNVFVRKGERLIDELGTCDQFLAVTDAVVRDHAGEMLYSSDFLTVNRDHVVWILPKEEMRRTAGGGGGEE